MSRVVVVGVVVVWWGRIDPKADGDSLSRAARTHVNHHHQHHHNHPHNHRHHHHHHHYVSTFPHHDAGGGLCRDDRRRALGHCAPAAVDVDGCAPSPYIVLTRQAHGTYSTTQHNTIQYEHTLVVGASYVLPYL
ncbi:hypothetical protein EDC01DRAFT_304895 [Geopyxis carbonaria]|nr:hypothetical protein EDC01DRAFT_304895 [Geopyxis carbonaria]